MKSLTESAWQPIETGFLGKERLQQWVEIYFGEKQDLTGFERKNVGLGTELRNKKRNAGYAFVGPMQLDRDFTRRMQDLKQMYLSQGTTILREFVNHPDEIAGFSWRAN